MKTGDKVVCIKDCVGRSHSDGRLRCYHPNGIPKKDDIFVIEGFRLDHFGDLGLFLVGKPCIAISTGEPIGWSSTKFRLLEHAQALSELEYLKEQAPAH